MRRIARTDSNHTEVINAFRQLGWSVYSTHQLGGGFPDIVVAKNSFTALVEVKDGNKPPSKRQLTPDEKIFHENWQGEIVIIESLDDILEFHKSHSK